MGSSRFPGKPLQQMLGLELVMHVYERCILADCLDRVVVATCDAEIRIACQARGAEVIMTRDDHAGAVDRTAEAVELLADGLADDGLALMVQGDEALVAPDMINAIVETFSDSELPVINLASPVKEAETHEDPNVVKVACALNGRALYFSRSPIPSCVRTKHPSLLQQTGVIGFSKSFLSTFLRLERTPLEITEGIDMLRTLEHGYGIQIVAAKYPTIGVDTPEDLRQAEHILRSDPITKKYLETK